MGTKYYTRFLLQAVDPNEVDEYSGVVELQANNQGPLEAKEIEALLANSFDLDTCQVQLLNWSPLHFDYLQLVDTYGHGYYYDHLAGRFHRSQVARAHHANREIRLNPYEIWRSGVAENCFNVRGL